MGLRTGLPLCAAPRRGKRRYEPNTAQHAPCSLRDRQRGAGRADGDLPLELDSFVGRSAELAALARALGAARQVKVTGAVGVGVGKSRLATRTAVRCAPRDGVWRMEPAPVRDPEFVDHTVVEALGLTDHTTRHSRETLLAHLAERQLLLVLDGFEHPAEACASLVGELLGRLPGLRVLGVGRRPLAVAVQGDAAEAAVCRARRRGCPVGGSAPVRLGVLQRPARAVRGHGAGAAERPAVRELRGGGGAAGAGGGGAEGAGTAAGRRPVAAGAGAVCDGEREHARTRRLPTRKGGETAG